MIEGSTRHDRNDLATQGRSDRPMPANKSRDAFGIEPRVDDLAAYGHRSALGQCGLRARTAFIGMENAPEENSSDWVIHFARRRHPSVGRLARERPEAT